MQAFIDVAEVNPRLISFGGWINIDGRLIDEVAHGARVSACTAVQFARQMLFADPVFLTEKRELFCLGWEELERPIRKREIQHH